MERSKLISENKVLSVSVVFCVMMPYGHVDGYPHFISMYCLFIQAAYEGGMFL